jgi:hypothetical protein
VNPIEVHCAYDELVSLEKLVPNPRNPNTHPENQIRLLAKIIEAQGWRAPITVSKRSGFIVRGHGRLEAARVLKCESAPVEQKILIRSKKSGLTREEWRKVSDHTANHYWDCECYALAAAEMLGVRYAGDVQVKRRRVSKPKSQLRNQRWIGDENMTRNWPSPRRW